MSSIQEELTKTIAKLVAEASDKAFRSGFYTGQAQAGVELEDCHKNWEKLREKLSDEH